MSAEAIRLVVGLGNPGADHQATRHNAGFWFADRLGERTGASFRRNSRFHGELAECRLAGTRLLVLKPDTYMNRSGAAVQAVAAFHKLAPAQILVVHDDLDLSPGTARLKRGGGHGGHNGLRDIHRTIGPDYLRLRLGIGHPGHRDAVIGYVLGRPTRAQEHAIREAIERGVDALELALQQGWDAAVRSLHSAA